MSVHTQAEEGITGSTPCVKTAKDAQGEISGERLIITSSGVLLQSCTNYVLLRHTTNILICIQTHTSVKSPKAPKTSHKGLHEKKKKTANEILSDMKLVYYII